MKNHPGFWLFLGFFKKLRVNLNIRFLLIQNHSALIKIYHHSFNRGLHRGNLPKAKFLYYLEQDALYLKDYAKGLQLIASRLPKEDEARQFRLFAQDTIKLEDEIQLHYLKQLSSPSFFKAKTVIKSKAITEYTQYLLQYAEFAPLAEAVASFIPCFWIYYELGKQMQSATKDSENYYKDWIAGYLDPQFQIATEQIIRIGDGLLNNPNTKTQLNNIANAISKSIDFEYQFFEECFGNLGVRTASDNYISTELATPYSFTAGSSE